MTHAAPARILVLSSRPDILSDVGEAAQSLDPVPMVRGLFGRTLSIEEGDLIIVDVAEPRATASYLRRRFGEHPVLVALIEGAWVKKLGATLADDWDDYLFYPLNLNELGLVWRRHTVPAEALDLTLDVDELGRLHAVIPSDGAYQRPVVDRVVEACRHLADLDGASSFRLRVALAEAVANAILYGSGDRDGAIVRITAAVESDGLRVSVTDEGDGFDPTRVPDPTGPEGIGRSRGRGLFLLRELSDAVEFNEVGNEVSLIFRGAVDPLVRIEPWLQPFADLTGLDFRLDRMREGASTCVFDASGSNRAARDHVVAIGPDGLLRLEYSGAGPDDSAGPEPAAALLAGWLEAIAESEESKERLIERRTRRARMVAELESARDLQLRLLPAPGEFSDLATVAARCEPALSLGGDFYHLARLPDSRLGLMIGDVSSHGPSAALIMALTLSAAAVATASTSGPAATLDALHGQLLSALESTEMYMTLFYAVLDRKGESLTFANAGHPYAYRLAEDGVERLPALDPPIGVVVVTKHQEREIAWRPTDTLLAFTDGLAELRDPLDESSSVIRTSMTSGALDPAQLVEALFAGTDDEMRLDDRTAIAAKW